MRRKRPILLRLIPDRLKIRVYSWLYQSHAADSKALYRESSLRFATNVRINLVPGDFLSGAIAFTGLYEPLSRTIANLSRAGGLFVDVGANLGYFTLLWLAGHPENRVIAFEASPINARLLRENIELNGFSDRVTVHEVAVGAASGRMSFDPGPVDQTGHGGLAHHRNERCFDVTVVTLDEVLGAIPHIALLKIDVEGADTLVLAGARKLLERQAVGEIWYEQLMWRMKELGVDPMQAEELLCQMGYAPMPLGDSSGGLVEWRAVPAS